MSHKPKLIGVTGKAGSGKDTFAQHFTDNRGFKRYGFADPIKTMISVGFGVPPEMWEDRELKERPLSDIGRSPRYLAQALGNEWGRELVHPDVWLLLAERMLDQVGFMIIPDVRFENEAEWVREQGGIIVEIARDNGLDVDNAGHASEAGIPNDLIDYVVANDGTIDNLMASARVIAEAYGC